MAYRPSPKTSRTDGPFCGAKTKRGVPCKAPAGSGTEHTGTGRCKSHGGSTTNGAIDAAKQAAVVMGVSVDIEPHEALLQCVRITAGEVAYCNQRIAQLSHEDAVGEPLEVVDIETEFPDGGVINRVERKRKVPQMHPWIRARADSLDRLARFAKMALDAGVEERKVRVAESWGDRLAELLRAILGDIKLDSEQEQRAPEVIRRHLTALERAPEVLGVGDDA